MIIALDYDDTYTRDPDGWLEFVKHFRKRGHWVHVVTMRRPDEPVDPALALTASEVHYTSHEFKRPFMRAKGIEVHVWIDDMPEMVTGPDAALSWS